MPLPPELREGRKHIDVPGAWRFRFEQHQRPHERRNLFEVSEIVGIVEPVADETGGDLAIDLRDHGIAIGEAALLPCGALAPDLEDRLPRRSQRAPQMRRQTFTCDIDEHGKGRSVGLHRRTEGRVSYHHTSIVTGSSIKALKA